MNRSMPRASLVCSKTGVTAWLSVAAAWALQRCAHPWRVLMIRLSGSATWALAVSSGALSDPFGVRPRFFCPVLRCSASRSSRSLRVFRRCSLLLCGPATSPAVHCRVSAFREAIRHQTGSSPGGLGPAGETVGMRGNQALGAWRGQASLSRRPQKFCGQRPPGRCRLCRSLRSASSRRGLPWAFRPVGQGSGPRQAGAETMAGRRRKDKRGWGAAGKGMVLGLPRRNGEAEGVSGSRPQASGAG